MDEANTVVCSGFRYKLGRHGLVFRWDAGEWRKSNRKWAEVSKGRAIQPHPPQKGIRRHDGEFNDD